MRELLLTGEGHRQILQACGEAGLTPGMLKMSMQLSAEEPQAMRELARRFHCDASYVTSVVDGLEQAGIAERRPHPSDRRIKTVVLTERGVEVLAQVNFVLDAPPSAFDVLSSDEQEQLCSLLGRVAEAARDVPAGSALETPAAPGSVPVARPAG
jgi:DNA-binding MarR family transcriptional regulator